MYLNLLATLGKGRLFLGDKSVGQCCSVFFIGNVLCFSRLVLVENPHLQWHVLWIWCSPERAKGQRVSSVLHKTLSYVSGCASAGVIGLLLMFPSALWRQRHM